MTQAIAYLGFDGTCAEAMRFYEKALRGKLELMMSGADSPMAEDDPQGDGAPHPARAARRCPAAASSTPATRRATFPTKGSRASSSPSTTQPVAEAESVFAALSEGGKVTMPMSAGVLGQALRACCIDPLRHALDRQRRADSRSDPAPIGIIGDPACPNSESTASASRSTATAPARTRPRATRSASAARRCTSGSSPPARSSDDARQGRRHDRRRRRLRGARHRRTSAPGSSAATCSGRCAGRGPTTSWKGWWGDEPPYHVPVFVLTHHARAPIEMEGGTTFHFVTDGIHAALERAREAAAGQGRPPRRRRATIRQYLRAGLIDEMHLAISPPARLGRACSPASTCPRSASSAPRTSTPNAPHVVFTRR